MATKFPSLPGSGTVPDNPPRIWYGIATAHDFESHDGMTERSLPKGSSPLTRSPGEHRPLGWGTVPYRLQGNFESVSADPLHRPSHRSRDLGILTSARGHQPPSPRRAQLPGNIAYSGLYTVVHEFGMTTNAELYQGSICHDDPLAWALFAGWLHPIQFPASLALDQER